MFFWIVIHGYFSYAKSGFEFLDAFLELICEIFGILASSGYFIAHTGFCLVLCGYGTLFLIEVLKPVVLEYEPEVGIGFELAELGGNEQIYKTVDGFLYVILVFYSPVGYLKRYFYKHA